MITLLPPVARHGLALVFTALLALTAPAFAARDAFVLISGGGTPLNNNYSQYLQAQAIAAFFEQNYPADQTWVFFGAGNRSGEPVIIADTRRQYKEDGLVLESWLPGPLTDNRPATRESIFVALRDEILPSVADGGTLYLFVGDHGELTREDPIESIITLWQMKHDPNRRGTGWYSDREEVLAVSELQEVLRAGLGQGRVVFCMTQCHSGGFQFLGVPRQHRPVTDWFTVVPDWAMPTDTAPLPRAAGFTATDEASLAAGCDPDPDPDRWAGYERFLPENLLGLDLFTREPAGVRRESFAAAHEEAVLVNRTIDKPRSSSEQYLEQWADLIDEHLIDEPHLTPTIRRHLEAYRHAVDTGRVAAADPLLQERAAQFQRFIVRLTEQNTTVKDLLLTGSREDLENAMGPAANRPGRPGATGRRRGANREALLAAWNDTLRPAWREAVLAGEVTELSEHALAFEKRLLHAEDRGRQLMIYTTWQNPLLNDIFWNSTYAFPDQFDAERADAVTRWGAERRPVILAWGRDSANEDIRQAANTLSDTFGRRTVPTTTQTTPEGPPSRTTNVSLRPLSPRTAAERTHFYRRVLAAWQFLLAAEATEALAELQALIDLERTPLPPFEA